MDALARGLRNAARLVEEGAVEALRAARYAGWADRLGRRARGEGREGLRGASCRVLASW